MNYKYAQLKSDRVIRIVDVDYPITKDDENAWIEISHANPTPQVGWLYHRDTGLFGPLTEEVIIFDQAKVVARHEIDVAAGVARKRFISDIPGQSEIYREKYEQAIDFLSSAEQVRYADYPLLEVESKVLDVPMKNVAETIVKRRSKWITKISAIESLRLYGKYNLDGCSNTNEVNKLKAHIIRKLDEIK